MWDFDKDPTIKPTFYNDPNADVHYQGPDDPFLWTSDYVAMNLGGSVVWDGTAGTIGIDNSFGLFPLFGTVTFHIDNWDDANRYKDIWLEMETIKIGGAVLPSLTVQMPGHTITGYSENIYDLGGDRYRENYRWIVEPNPEWEEITLSFSALAGTQVYVDSFHVATACIPEPTTILLMSFGVFGLFGIIIRNRRKQKRL
jgi:hypothetical protein